MERAGGRVRGRARGRAVARTSGWVSSGRARGGRAGVLSIAHVAHGALDDEQQQALPAAPCLSVTDFVAKANAAGVVKEAKKRNAMTLTAQLKVMTAKKQKYKRRLLRRDTGAVSSDSSADGSATSDSE